MQGRSFVAISLTVLVVTILLFYQYGRSYWYPFYTKLVGKDSVSEIVLRYQDTALERIKRNFKSANISFPPKELAFLALGPKLREGDRQVPEGIYQVSWLNPNSSYHLSLKLNYPNDFDLKWAKEESRSEPGTNIFIHGKAVSIGCLAMGDSAIEELFLLTDAVGKEQVRVIISPVDPRLKTLTNNDTNKEWVGVLYQNINDAFLAVTGNGE